MKLIQSRGVKMILHLISVFIFSVPITTHILKIALDESFSINGYDFTHTDSLWIIGTIIVIVSANIYSIIKDRWHKLSMFITGSFLFVITIVQIGVLNFGIDMNIYGLEWPRIVSVIEILITGTVGIILLVSSVFINNNKGMSNDRLSIHISLSRYYAFLCKFFKNESPRMRKLAFLLGIFCSLLLAVPLCGILYLVADALLVNPDNFNVSKLEPNLSPDMVKFLGWLGIVGMQGSIISMFLRFRNFEEHLNQIDGFGLFLNALLRPYIGLSFAHLSFFMLEAGLLQDTVAPSASQSESFTQLNYSFSYHVSIAFIAGFTERIANKIQTKETDNNGRNEDSVNKTKKQKA